jgi:membrane peptidoglycan carboxypeptidase
VEDSALDNRAVMIGGTTGILGEWGPETAENRYEGPITARDALSKSKNGATIRLGMNPGVESVIDLCRRAGVKSPLRPYPATFLGSSEITLSELALAYTIFPNGGWRPTLPHVLERIEEKDGTIWHAQPDYGKQDVIKPETAYEVHSCLVDALERGTGKDARANFGLKKMEAAGKTGTAYDFTDVLFAGYDSAITCAVWAGFDKPQQIFRGAFGRDIALPVWVDVLNASATHYPAKEIPQPRGLERVNICAKSGLLATDKCVEKIKVADGEMDEKTTYLELATSAQKPSETCNIHGEMHASLTRDLPVSEFPRAALAVDTSAVKPVIPKEPTLLAARDPYNSVHAMVNPRPTAAPSPEPQEEVTSEEMPDPTKPVLKAIPVQPSEGETSEPTPTPVPSEAVIKAIKPTGSPVEIRRAIPVVRPSPQASEPEVRRAEPVEEDESN